MELGRYHLESCIDNDDNDIFISVMFKEYFSFCSQAYQKDLPSRKNFERINQEYFINYYDFAFITLQNTLDNMNKIDQITEKDQDYILFCKLPSLSIVNYENYFFNVFKK